MNPPELPAPVARYCERQEWTMEAHQVAMNLIEQIHGDSPHEYDALTRRRWWFHQRKAARAVMRRMEAIKKHQR